VLPAVVAGSCTREATGPATGSAGDLEAVDPVPWAARRDLAVAGKSPLPLPLGLVWVTSLVDLWIRVATSSDGGGRPVSASLVDLDPSSSPSCDSGKPSFW
jgi:hypothetical protein